MKTSTHYLFKNLKQILKQARLTPSNRAKIVKKIRYIEQSSLISNTMAQNVTQTIGRIVRLIKRYHAHMPTEFLNEFLHVFQTLQEHQEAAKRDIEKIDRGG